jgi:DNA-binding NtrC family response regulator
MLFSKTPIRWGAMIFSYQTASRSGSIEAPEARDAAQFALNGERPVYSGKGNQWHQPWKFHGAHTLQAVDVYTKNPTQINCGGINMPGVLAGYEIEIIKNAIKIAGGNRTEAAELLGIKRPTLVEKIKRLGIAE